MNQKKLHGKYTYTWSSLDNHKGQEELNKFYKNFSNMPSKSHES